MTAPISTAAPATGGRFVVASDQLELVGVLEGRLLLLYLDRFADNAPVPDARIELELGTQRLRAVAEGDRYAIELGAPLPRGALPVVATVIAADLSDLLAGELIVLAAGESPVPAARTGAAAGAGAARNASASASAADARGVTHDGANAAKDEARDGSAAGTTEVLGRIGDTSWRGVAIGGGIVAAAALGWLVGRRGRRA